MQIAVGNSARVLEQLVSLEADVGVLGTEHAHPELTVAPLFRDPLVVVVPRGHAWARRRSAGTSGHSVAAGSVTLP